MKFNIHQIASALLELGEVPKIYGDNESIWLPEPLMAAYYSVELDVLADPFVMVADPVARMLDCLDLEWDTYSEEGKTVLLDPENRDTMERRLNWLPEGSAARNFLQFRFVKTVREDDNRLTLIADMKLRQHLFDTLEPNRFSRLSAAGIPQKALITTINNGSLIGGSLLRAPKLIDGPRDPLVADLTPSLDAIVYSRATACLYNLRGLKFLWPYVDRSKLFWLKGDNE
jgi:hypothetical protein